MNDTDRSRERRQKIVEEFCTKVGVKETRKMKSRCEKDRGILFGLGMFGLVGWSIAIPTLIGVAAGLWIDKTWPSHISWTLTLLLIGVVLGCINAWHWVAKESKHD
ncbi:MAG: hypothetical protein AMS17_11710 [Spirochaetes bacterium DG_61]|nr:MAG: hypothetical protein AMS17_11710 [Spirochaetes bacterium DG_61]